MLRAISLWQPWASAIACGSKTFETRSWPASSRYYGETFAIHAAKRWTAEEKEAVEYYRDLGIDLGFQGFDPPLGGVVAVATLSTVYPVSYELTSNLSEQEWNLGDYSPGRFAWEFTDVKPVEFFPLTGRQGIWTLDDCTRLLLIARTQLSRVGGHPK